jgi:hypothetical protein
VKICFNFEHVFNSNSKDVENSVVLRSLLDCLVGINLNYLARHKVKPLYQSGVRYGRTKVWEPIPELYARGYGDCKSLATALIAEYQKMGVDCRPVFRWYKNRLDGRDFHILVMVPGRNGYDKKLFEDPSRKLGMGRIENG